MKAVYFSHDEDARNDPKVMKLRAKYGMEGYGCYFAMLEMFSSESGNGHSLDYSQEQFDAITYDLRSSLDVKEFIDKCIEVGLFQTDGERFWSESFNRRFDEVAQKARERSEKAQKAVNARWAKRKAASESEKPKNEPEDMFSIDGLDPDWVRFVQTYEQNIGLIPHGGSKSGQLLEDYYNELGADVMCKAVEETNLAHPDNPERFILAILKNWAELGVKTLEQANAATLEHERKAGNWKKRQDGNAGSEPPAIRGKFW